MMKFDKIGKEKPSHKSSNDIEQLKVSRKSWPCACDDPSQLDQKDLELSPDIGHFILWQLWYILYMRLEL